MNYEEIKNKVKEMESTQAIHYVNTLGLKLSLIRDMDCEKLFRVENSKEINYISISYMSLVTKKACIGFVLNS